MSIPIGGSHNFLFYGYIWLSLHTFHSILPLYFHLIPFLISFTTILDLYPFALHRSHFATPFGGDFYYERTPLCYLLTISLHCLCSKHGTMPHPTHFLLMILLCLPSFSLNHEIVVHLAYFYLFFGLCELFTKKTLS